MKQSYLLTIIAISPKIKTILAGFAMILLSSSAYAQTTPSAQVNDKPITIDANNQQIDIQKNTITFSGDVVIIQEGLQVKADTVVITEMQSKDKQTITANGVPVYFEQKLDDDPTQTIIGHAKQLIYNVKENTVTLIGKAELFQKDSKISGARITYDVAQQKIIAQSTKGERVQTILTPNQVKEINK